MCESIAHFLGICISVRPFQLSCLWTLSLLHQIGQVLLHVVLMLHEHENIGVSPFLYKQQWQEVRTSVGLHKNCAAGKAPSVHYLYTLSKYYPIMWIIRFHPDIDVYGESQEVC